MEHLVRKDKVEQDAQEHPKATESEMRETLAHTSPEGRPADPQLHGRDIRWLIALVPVGIIVCAVVLWLLGLDQRVAIAMGAFGLVAFLISPVVWSSMLRARERDEVDREAGHHHPPPAPPTTQV